MHYMHTINSAAPQMAKTVCISLCVFEAKRGMCGFKAAKKLFNAYSCDSKTKLWWKFNKEDVFPHVVALFLYGWMSAMSSSS